MINGVLSETAKQWREREVINWGAFWKHELQAKQWREREVMK